MEPPAHLRWLACPPEIHAHLRTWVFKRRLRPSEVVRVSLIQCAWHSPERSGHRHRGRPREAGEETASAGQGRGPGGPVQPSLVPAVQPLGPRTPASATGAHAHAVAWKPDSHPRLLCRTQAPLHSLGTGHTSSPQAGPLTLSWPPTALLRAGRRHHQWSLTGDSPGGAQLIDRETGCMLAVRTKNRQERLRRLRPGGPPQRQRGARSSPRRGAAAGCRLSLATQPQLPKREQWVFQKPRP